MASAGLPGTQVVAPGRRLSCPTRNTGQPATRAHSSVSAMRVSAWGPSGSTTLPIGAKYSCWASMMMSAVLSIGGLGISESWSRAGRPPPPCPWGASARAGQGRGRPAPRDLGGGEPASDPVFPRERPLLLEDLLLQVRAL